MTLLAEREVGIHLEYPVKTPDSQDLFAGEKQPTETAQSKFAKNAVARFFEWIKDCPNNPGYLQSPTYLGQYNWLTENSYALQCTIKAGLKDLRFDYIPSDIGSFYRLKYGEQDVQYDAEGNSSPVAKMFTAENIAYGGIKEIVHKAYQYHTLDKENPVESYNEATAAIVLAVGAVVVRAHYLEEIISRQEQTQEEGTAIPELEDMINSFDSMYRQNILSNLQRASILQQAAERLAIATQSAILIDIPRIEYERRAA